MIFLMKEIMDNEAEEDYILEKHLKFRKDVDPVYKYRRNEGAFRILIDSHLVDNEEKFQRYFRLSRERFSFVLNFIQKDLTTPAYNRVKEPITAAEKLALTLR